MFGHFVWSSSEGCPSHSKISDPKWGNSSQIHTSMFTTNPSIHQNICRMKCRSRFLCVSQEVHLCLFLNRILARLQISKNISLIRPCLYLKPESPLQLMSCMLAKLSRHTLRQIGKTSSLWNNGIMRWYIRMVRYSTGDMCWSNLSMKIARRKSWANVI
jgi:hypothetical protein